MPYSLSKTVKSSSNDGKVEAKQSSAIGSKKPPQNTADKGKTNSSKQLESTNISASPTSLHTGNSGTISNKATKKLSATNNNSSVNVESGKSRFGFGFAGAKQTANTRDHMQSLGNSKLAGNLSTKPAVSDEKATPIENYCAVTSFSPADDSQAVNPNEKPAIYGAVEGPLVFSKANSISPECEDVFEAELPTRKNRLLVRSQSGPEGDCSVQSESPVSPVRHMSVSSGADDQPVILDAVTYRHLTYELMVMKTMLLKLKRSMQEGESQTPSLSSQPCTPQQEVPDKLITNESSTVAERPKSFLSHLASRPIATETRQLRSPLGSPSRALDLAVQENRVLKQQVASLQQSLADCDVTIQQLQQTANGHSGIIKSCADVAVQTEQDTVTGGHHGNAAVVSQPLATTDSGSTAAGSHVTAKAESQGQSATVVGRGATRVSRIARKAVQSAVYSAH